MPKKQSPKNRVEKAVAELLPGHKSLKGWKIERVFEIRSYLFIIVPKGHRTKLIGRGGKTAEALADKLRKHIRIIEKGSEPEVASRSIFYPITPASITTIYPPDSKPTLRVQIKKDDVRKLPITKAQARKVMSEATGRAVEVVS